MADASNFSFNVGDRATVMMKKRVSGIGWGPSMDSAIGKTGTVTEHFLQNKKITGYRLTIQEMDNWIYPIECLQPAYPIDFKEGDKVVIWRKPDDEELLAAHNWVSDMDDLVGKEGTISDVLDDGSFCVDIDGNQDTGYNGISYYFPVEALARPSNSAQAVVPPTPHRSKWFLGEFSGKPYRSIDKDRETGHYTLEDENGAQSSSQYMRVYEAPHECKSFSYRRAVVEDMPF